MSFKTLKQQRDLTRNLNFIFVAIVFFLGLGLLITYLVKKQSLTDQQKNNFLAFSITLLSLSFLYFILTLLSLDFITLFFYIQTEIALNKSRSSRPTPTTPQSIPLLQPQPNSDIKLHQKQSTINNSSLYPQNTRPGLQISWG